MAGDILAGLGEIEAGFLLEHPEDGEAHGHQGRLRIGGERQFVPGPFEHHLRELLGERVVEFLEDVARLREGVREIPAHAGGLGPLPRKYERTNRHDDPVCVKCRPGWARMNFRQ